MKYFFSVFTLLVFCGAIQGQTIVASGPTSFCEGGNVVLSLNPPRSGTYQWLNGTTPISNATAPTYSVTGSGSYRIVVTNGAIRDTSNNITVTENPLPATPTFTFTTNAQCANLPFKFVITAPVPGVTYTWDFGDTESASGSTVDHVFNAIGNGSQNYSVRVLATTAAGCTSRSAPQVLNVKQKPDASLSDFANLPEFTRCASVGSSTDFTLTVTNSTTTPGTNTLYEINWGDASAPFSDMDFSSQTHLYSSLGFFTITHKVTGQNGCANTSLYTVFNGSNPGVGLSSSGSTIQQCIPASDTFYIDSIRVKNNPPGTTYTVTFNDGTPNLVFAHPPPLSFVHVFNSSSCDATGAINPNSFYVRIRAENPCGFLDGAVEPITTVTSPKPGFRISPDSVACANSVINFVNTSQSGSVVNNNVCDNTTIINWQITPATGWTINNGSLGTVNPDNNPATWGSENLGIIFTTTGTYSVKLIARNKTNPGSPCRLDSLIRTVCITTAPTPGFSVSGTSGCIPFVVNATNDATFPNNCKAPAYRWEISNYESAFCGTSEGVGFVNGTSETSENPSFSFTSPGTYTITQHVTNGCGTFSSSKIVNVKKPPEVAIIPPSYPCGTVTITPAATVTSCGSTTPTYAWTFAGGSRTGATSLDPGPVTFTSIGPHAITLSATNECGTTTGTETIVVAAAPDVVVPPNQSLCGGLNTTPLNFTSTLGTPVYNWVNSNPSIGLEPGGRGNIPSFPAVNNGTSPITATITVTPVAGGSCSGPAASFTITVNPRPAIPVTQAGYTYCQGTPATPLTGTAAPGNILTWYNNSQLTGGTPTAPTPLTTVAGIILYYVTQTNTAGCVSPPAVITITVNPAITGNTILGNRNICANTRPEPLAGSGNVSGGEGSYVYQWQRSTNGGGTWANIQGATDPGYSPPALSVTTGYRRLVTSAACEDTSNTVTVTVEGALANYEITGPQTICEVSVPALLSGQLPTGGGGSYSYVWESSTDNANWTPTGSTGQNYQPPPLPQTTYFRRKVSASQCDAVSGVITITVNPLPGIELSAVNPSICEYEAGIVSLRPIAGVAPFAIELTVKRPNNADTIFTRTIGSNDPATISIIPANSQPGTYTITLTKITDGNTCIRTGNISVVNIVLKPKPVLTTSAAPTICSGASTQPITVSGADSYTWSPSAGLSSTTGNSVIADPSATTTYTVTGTRSGCENTADITVTVTPGATVAATGPARVVCNASSATLSANAAVVGTGSWKQLSGPAATVTDVNQDNTTITGLAFGQRYIFQWTITGLAPCPATTSNDTLDVLSAIINGIKRDTVICSGQSVVLADESLSGGSTNALNASYTFQWESAPPGQTNWQAIPGATDINLSVSPLTSTCYRRKVKSNNSCETASNIVCVTVNPAIGNNLISATQSVCVNIQPAELTGAVPGGGDGNFLYQWQTSMNENDWTDISSNINFQPLAYPRAGQHYFRRNVNGGNCTSSSNVVSVTVRPDSKALFTAGTTVSCAPFNLQPVITVSVLPDSNELYQWYENGALFGSNNSGLFPAYTLESSGDTTIIKLVTTSPYGCKPDSVEQQFITVITALAKFNKDATEGCGPLQVNFTNTSNLLNSDIQYIWNFGNGVTSSAEQPGMITFNSSPFYTDTTYQVSLKAYNGCDTTVWLDSVKVRANPQARFGVDTTFGCSPFIVQIDNTSPGNNTYYWDFGNGDRDTTSAAGIFNYRYNVGNSVDTFTIRLIAENECRRDTQMINIRVAPNTIRPLINVNSSQLYGCAPHTISFNNNTSGATGYRWNFGDNSPLVFTNNNQTTVTHTYNQAGVFTVAVDISNGCSDTTVFREVTVYDKPVAGFTPNAISYCAGDTVRVSNLSQHATNYRWFWGDGTNSAGETPVHVYTAGGNYNILLRAERTNNTGLVCLDTLVVPVTVLTKPEMSVQSNLNTINCAPFTLDITAPGIINETVTWYIIDSTVSPAVTITNGISARYTFQKPGTFSVKMIAVNSLGCADSSITSFSVRGKAIASFMPGNLQVCSRDTTISCINTSTYNGTDPLNYRWLVNNVVLSANGNFTHRYTVLPNVVLPRAFTTSLIVSNTVGCSDTATATLQVNPTARAQFDIINMNDCVPYTPTIVNSSTNASAYQWFLNDSLVSIAPIPAIALTGGSVPYKITLIAGNTYGCKPDTFSIDFISRARPLASFRLSDTLGCTGVLNVGTSNLTTGASTYTWNWGDGTPNSFFTNPTHLYNTPGQYLVTLVASDGICTDTTEQLVKVSVKPTVDFAVDQTITCDTARVQFTNLSVNSNNYIWSFGDGTASTETNPSKSFSPRNAAYTVKLLAESSLGCKDSAVKANLVLAKVPPAADFFISPTPVITVPNYTFSFNNLTLNSANYKYLWSLGDGTFATTRDVTRKYADTGNYRVLLIVLDTVSNCTDTTLRVARVDGFPGYLYVPNAICPACIETSLREFMPKGAGLKEYRLQVFTTWGELVFETKALDNKGGPTQAWDGKFKGVIVQQDVFIWRIDARFLNGSEWLGMIYPGESKYKKVGTITVIK